MVQSVAADTWRCRPARSAGRPAGRLAGRLAGTGQSAADTRGTRSRGAVHCPRPTVRQPGVGPAHGRPVRPRIDPPPPRPAEKEGVQGM